MAEIQITVVNGALHIDGMLVQPGAFIMDSVEIENSDIVTLPERLTIFGELHIFNCHNLTHLPYRLVVGQGILIEDCDEFEQFGMESFAGNFLDITSCDKIESLPADMIVHGSIGAFECAAFKPFTFGMNQANVLQTEKFVLRHDSVMFFDRIPLIIEQSALGKVFGSVFDVPMIDGFPQMSRKIERIELDRTGGYMVYHLA